MIRYVSVDAGIGVVVRVVIYIETSEHEKTAAGWATLFGEYLTLLRLLPLLLALLGRHTSTAADVVVVVVGVILCVCEGYIITRINCIEVVAFDIQ